MLGPEIQKNVPTWTTQDGRKIPITDLEDQHLCNCYWFSKIMWGSPHFRITDEVTKRFGKNPLPFKPLPVNGEIQWLKQQGVINGTDIIFEGKKIGSISHLDKGKYAIL